MPYTGQKSGTTRMRIKSLYLENFRNYDRQTFVFSEGLNVICGANGAGKTNALESVFVLSLFRSPRTAKEKELVRFESDHAKVKAVVEKKYGSGTIDLFIDAAGKKKALVGGLPIKRAAELVGVLGTVMFSPDEMRLVKETPAERRRFLDIGLSQQQRAYFVALMRYNKVLKQKNNFLKECFGDLHADDMLSVWDVQLAEYGASIAARRKKYVSILDKEAAVVHARLSDDKEKLSLGYECAAEGQSEDEIKTELLAALEKSREKDKKLGFCTVGPHRDDIAISINGLDGRKFASQGQQRSVALAMKLAEAEIYKKEKGEYPVLLLDDVLSELDAGRQKKLIELTEGMQTILTCTEFSLPVQAKKFLIKDGVVTGGER